MTTGPSSSASCGQPSVDLPAQDTRRWWVWLLGALATVVILGGVIVFTGVPGLRPSLRSASALVDKINAGGCSPEAAKVDWVTGMVETIGEPGDPRYALTSDEKRILKTNGKVGLLCGAVK